MNQSETHSPREPEDLLTYVVRVFLESQLSIILIILSLIIGFAALWLTPREEDPQIVVPLADIYVNFPGHSAAEVEQLVASPLERMLYQIDGVEYVYSMSRDDSAIITVRFYVGQDRERSLVKLFKKLNENAEQIPAGVTGWVMKPVEIDDVPIVTLALTGAADNSYSLRRISEELVERLAVVPKVSRAYVVGGQARTVSIELEPDRLLAHKMGVVEVKNSVALSNVASPASSFTRADREFQVAVQPHLTSAADVSNLVVGVFDDRPVFLKDVAKVSDGPDEVSDYVRFGWGAAGAFEKHESTPGWVIGSSHGHKSLKVENPSGAIQSSLAGGDARVPELSGAGGDGRSPELNRAGGDARAPELSGAGGDGRAPELSGAGGDGRSPELSGAGTSSSESVPAVTIAISKQKGANAVGVANEVIREANRLRDEILPEDVELIVTRNSGIVANEKVNELIEALGVAIVIVILLLTFGLGWREALIVSIAVPVVFGLTLAVNLLFGYTINRVTLFALILALGLLVDDPIVDVENIARHFEHRKKATRQIVLDAVAEIRPPLISATLAVIVSFLPMFFITGMMGPYMSPMALNVPVAMVMSMFVAFTITPWLSYHILTWGTKLIPNADEDNSKSAITLGSHPAHEEAYDPRKVQQSLLYRIFRPLMLPLLKTRMRATLFLVFMGGLTIAAMGLGALRMVPLKMLPFDNKNEVLFLLDMDEGTTLERTDGVVRRIESILAAQPEVINYVSTVGASGPIDFNGMVRHYYLRSMPFQAEVRANFVGKKNRTQQSHAIGLRLRDELEKLAKSENAKIQIVELPPGPPVLASLVAEVYGNEDSDYREILDSAATVAERLRLEPGVAEVDDIREASVPRLIFEPDQEKAALSGISVTDIANTIQIALKGNRENILRVDGERNPLTLTFRLPRPLRSNQEDLSQLSLKNARGQLVQLRELGKWRTESVSQTIYHKNLKRVAYVFAECVGRPPADCVIDILSDQLPNGKNFVEDAKPRSLAYRSFLSNGSGIDWKVENGMDVTFAGEGEWKITLDVFRDLGLAFAAAMLMIYIILVAQMRSFLVPIVVMLAIPLTALGVMPGFYMLNAVLGQTVGGYADPVYFTATAMIGMIALSGIVTRDSIILVDFMQQSVARGRPLFDAILESRVVRLRPILLTAGAALLSAIPITLDPIFSGLGWSLIFGLIASTLFTLFVIPVTYWLLYAENK